MKSGRHLVHVERDGWVWKTTRSIFLFSIAPSYSIFLLALRQDENEVDVWLAIRKEEFRQDLMSFPSSSSFNQIKHTGK